MKIAFILFNVILNSIAFSLLLSLENLDFQGYAFQHFRNVNLPRLLLFINSFRIIWLSYVFQDVKRNLLH